MSVIPRVWPTALKRGCVTQCDMLSPVMGFISLVDEIRFMLIISRIFAWDLWHIHPA